MPPGSCRDEALRAILQPGGAPSPASGGGLGRRGGLFGGAAGQLESAAGFAPPASQVPTPPEHSASAPQRPPEHCLSSAPPAPLQCAYQLMSERNISHQLPLQKLLPLQIRVQCSRSCQKYALVFRYFRYVFSLQYGSLKVTLMHQ